MQENSLFNELNEYLNNNHSRTLAEYLNGL